MIARLPLALQRTARIRHDVLSLLTIDYNNCVFDGESIDSLVSDLRQIMPAMTKPTVLASCVKYLIGQRPSPAALELLAWRLGGNYYRIARRRVVLPWRGQSIDEWVPAYVDQARPYITKRGKHGYIFRFKILAGFTAGLLTEQFWSDSFCRFISRDCGFTRRGSGARFQQGNQFVLLRFMLRISAVKSVTQPVFEGVMTPVPSPLLKWNRDIGKSRDRMTPFEGCPPGYQRPLVLPCHLCDVGFETCKNGTHRRQYVRGYCTMCDTIDSWIDPEFDDSVCIRCLFKVRINPAKAVLT